MMFYSEYKKLYVFSEFACIGLKISNTHSDLWSCEAWGGIKDENLLTMQKKTAEHQQGVWQTLHRRSRE